jgi:hypothetical protein
MEDDLNSFAKGRRPQYFGKWKTTSIFWQMEDNLNILTNGRRTKYFGKWKTTSICWLTEDDLDILENGRRPDVNCYYNAFIGCLT